MLHCNNCIRSIRKDFLGLRDMILHIYVYIYIYLSLSLSLCILGVYLQESYSPSLQGE